MTIGGWIGFAFVVIFIVGCLACAFACFDGTGARILCVLVSILLILGSLFGIRWFFKNTASGQRAMIDQKSNLNNGMDRIVTVYTATGDVLAQYQGKIDIEANEGGYIKFDVDGKRYIYYNCFVETIADIEGMQ